MTILVNIDVGDLDRATRFYRSALGLKVGRRFGAFAVELVGSNAPIYLLAKPAGSRATKTASQRRTYARHWTPVHLDVVVKNIERARRRAIAAGAKPEGPIRKNNWGKLAVVADPFGHGMCFIEFIGRGYDEIADKRSRRRNGGAQQAVPAVVARATRSRRR
jgi:catechol 2,3-dioxygenase-like lactoylglutathione lyase family enzyme